MTAKLRLPPGATLSVSLRWDAATLVPVGRLGMRQRQVLFEFDPQFLAGGVDISPFKLRRQPGVIETVEPAFEHLPGVFCDSLPDGWGRLLLDRAARRGGIAPETLTPLDRLAHVGSSGIGALVYRPVLEGEPGPDSIDLDEFARSSHAVLEGTSDELLDALRQIGGSPQGARPKALLQYHQPTGQLSTSPGDRGTGWRHILVKFRSPHDFADMGPLEFAYAQMATAAGVQMPPVFLLSSHTGPGYFAAERFDRDGERRRHVVTAAGLLHADFRLPSLDYVALAKVCTRLTRDHRQAEALFRQMVFNVLAHNRDDHAKQFSFCMTQTGEWSLSPAYDLTFSTGPGGEHTTTVAGEGKTPTIAQLHQVANTAGLSRQRAAEIIDHVQTAMSQWRHIASEAGVSRKTADAVSSALVRVGRQVGCD